MPSRRSLSTFAIALLSGAGSVILAVEAAKAQGARAAYGYVTANLNHRAGPGTQFPSLQVIPSRAQVTINGCLPSFLWCEGEYGGVRGWMSRDYLRLYDYGRSAWVEVGDYARSTQIATFNFELEGYWYAHYRNRPFYPQRAAWLAPRGPVVDDNVFYRELSPSGRWVEVEGRYVWMPRVGQGWRPYTEGRWEYGRRYGWTWVSNEPFGWATYHYGRWAYSNRLGWVWVPGRQWAPAWVAWRGSDDHLAWAPLPPDAGPDFALDDGFEEIPGYYWQVVPAASFLLPNLAEAILRDDGDRRRSLERSRPVGNVRIENNTVVNNVINIEYVEEKTRERVVPREVVITNDASRPAQASGEVLQIFQPPVTEAPVAETPPAVVPADVAASESTTAGQAGDEPATDHRVAAAAEAQATSAPTEAPPLAEEPAAAPATGTPVEEATDQPTDAAPPADGPDAGSPQPPAAPTEAPPPPSEQPPAAPVEEPPAAPEQPPAAPVEAPPPPSEQPPAAPVEEPPAAPAQPPEPPERPAPPAAEAESSAPPVEQPPPPPEIDEAPPPSEPEPPMPTEEPSPPDGEPAPPPPASEEPRAQEEPPPAADVPEPPARATEPPPPVDDQPIAAEPPSPPAPEAQEPEARPQGEACAEGMRMNRQGECVPRRRNSED